MGFLVGGQAFAAREESGIGALGFIGQATWLKWWSDAVVCRLGQWRVAWREWHGGVRFLAWGLLLWHDGRVWVCSHGLLVRHPR